MKVTISKHAIERYHQRVRECSAQEAARQIEALYARSQFLHETHEGFYLYQNSGIVLVKSPPFQGATIVTLYWHMETRHGRK